jgi:hypothetical protein
MSFAARLAAFSTAIILFAATGGRALAQKKYDTGATDTEIKIGNINPYSGPRRRVQETFSADGSEGSPLSDGMRQASAGAASVAIGR